MYNGNKGKAIGVVQTTTLPRAIYSSDIRLPQTEAVYLHDIIGRLWRLSKQTYRDFSRTCGCRCMRADARDQTRSGATVCFCSLRRRQRSLSLVLHKSINT
ncbi:unnamed protein product [Echinococcus multilocularis]|uniref:Unnamed protein product n=1 Tax=Echinococcus multilocularis TaxID=6211 RepID=A0A0S4MLQ7_ECHMU|nr:unnamed protein product [Echinococcus multilocularis]